MAEGQQKKILVSIFHNVGNVSLHCLNNECTAWLTVETKGNYVFLYSVTGFQVTYKLRYSAGETNETHKVRITPLKPWRTRKTDIGQVTTLLLVLYVQYTIMSLTF